MKLSAEATSKTPIPGTPGLGFFVPLAFACLFASICAATAANTPQPQSAGKGSVLPAERFPYPMKLGYAAARQYPEVIGKLFCYCGCDWNNKHTALLDCYRSTHGSYCGICMEECIKAKQLKESGAPLRKIQSQIDHDFARLYPYSKPSPQLLKYRASLQPGTVYPGPTASKATMVLTNSGAKHPPSACCQENQPQGSSKL